VLGSTVWAQSLILMGVLAFLIAFSRARGARAEGRSERRGGLPFRGARAAVMGMLVGGLLAASLVMLFFVAKPTVRSSESSSPSTIRSYPTQSYPNGSYKVAPPEPLQVSLQRRLQQAVHNYLAPDTAPYGQSYMAVEEPLIPPMPSMPPYPTFDGYRRPVDGYELNDRPSTVYRTYRKGKLFDDFWGIVPVGFHVFNLTAGLLILVTFRFWSRRFA